MGGSVAVHVAAKKSFPNLSGLVVVDVVEVCLSAESFSCVSYVALINVSWNFIVLIIKIPGNGHGFVDAHAENPIKQNPVFFNRWKSGSFELQSHPTLFLKFE